MTQSLQDRFAPHNACFGCGPANRDGLQLKSFVQGEEVVCTWQPRTMHEAFPGVLNGGIVGTLLDCHLNWTAAWHLMQQAGSTAPPCTVTAEYSVKLRRPTPTNAPVTLRARRRVRRGPGPGDGHARGRRQGLRDLRRPVRRRQRRAPGVPSLVSAAPARREGGTDLRRTVTETTQ